MDCSIEATLSGRIEEIIVIYHLARRFENYFKKSIDMGLNDTVYDEWIYNNESFSLIFGLAKFRAGTDQL